MIGDGEVGKRGEKIGASLEPSMEQKDVREVTWGVSRAFYVYRTDSPISWIYSVNTSVHNNTLGIDRFFVVVFFGRAAICFPFFNCLLGERGFLIVWRGLVYSLVSQPISFRAKLFSRMTIGDNTLLVRSAGSKRVGHYKKHWCIHFTHRYAQVKLYKSGNLWTVASLCREIPQTESDCDAGKLTCM